MDRPVIGVVGLGTMGLGIAQVYAQAGHAVLATDAHAPARANARERLAAALAPRVNAGKLDAAEAEAIASRLQVVDGPEGLADAALVIEAVAEDLAVKQDLFAAVERAVAADCVLATNTSSLSVRAIRDPLARPMQVIGLHFFNPAPVMKLVELVVPQGAEEAGNRARTLTEAAGKVVVDAPDSPGFIVNRCARPFYGEALALLEEGRAAAEIDAAMAAAGYRMGPFALIDLIGADINLAATRSLNAAMGGHPRYHVFAALEETVAAGRLGRKSGAGFVTPPGEAPAPPADAESIAARIEALLVNEAAWLAQESSTSRDAIDTALKLGLNFPRGPFGMLDRLGGPGAVLHILSDLRVRAPEALKPRYDPSPWLEALA
ncbi:3-hydroxybutyryl-CoA dehydrogenase [Rhodobacter sp. SGA-6-6]|uniref:3-hydroxyacyl-CoA dehydrogenase n=1 Tax=Rhodobacter sp. SGA-6-6 TaxID=2710882 RepID=UPI0013EBE577|nr:3-hydroxyacyl-CoA dehydrogenase NAD-binding domain-containing protein [Rhodobacter sp. SGA-6-6]NGM45572.1 3-hydroxybutyryl-CoA dehydrogenase [Rhodobacter sp. SGA-6-6]